MGPRHELQTLLHMCIKQSCDVIKQEYFVQVALYPALVISALTAVFTYKAFLQNKHFC